MQPLDIQHHFINQQVADNPTKLCHRAPFDRQINIRITRTRLESCSSQAPIGEERYGYGAAILFSYTFRGDLKPLLGYTDAD
jgi:hypothetical protein